MIQLSDLVWQGFLEEWNSEPDRRRKFLEAINRDVPADITSMSRAEVIRRWIKTST